MRINFVLPAWSKSPVGGFKIVYEYANRLSTHDYQVCIIHPLSVSDKNLNVLRKCNRLLKSKIHSFLGIIGRRNVRWFTVLPRVKLLITPTLAEKYIPTADIIIATAWETAVEVNRYSADKGKKFYLIQGYEIWSGSKDEVDATWSMPLEKIVVSRWLEEVALSMGQHARYIPNGIDFSRFTITQAINKRDPRTIGMLYHVHDWKGSAQGIEALRMVKNRFPTMKAIFFSVHKPGPDLPPWIEFHRDPSLEKLVEIYNSCSIFVSPSWTEGWGLPATEAMSCGCALVCTDNKGTREYAIHEKTALISRVNDPAPLAENIIRLIENNALRIEIAERGIAFIKQFTWEKALERLEAVITEK
jgi:glycosyltransferase involved in cell wall biosynthesis